MSDAPAPIPPDVGPSIDLRTGTTWASVVPGLGGRLAQVDLGDGPLLRPWAEGLSWAMWGAYPLLPWSNRIPDGRLRFGGREVQVPVTWPDGSAIHGLAASAPWEVVSSTGTTLDLGIEIATEPWRVEGSQRIEVGRGHVRLGLAVVNVGDRPVPAGLGIHPWFRAGPVRVPAAARWPGDPLPVGPPEPVDDDDLRRERVPPLMDRCFTLLEGTSADVPGARLAWTGPITQVVIYTGERGWTAVEPVTMANDGFSLAADGVEGHGVVVLAPGERLAVAYDLHRRSPIDG